MIYLPNQKFNPCKICGYPTRFGDRLCQDHGPDLEWEDAICNFYNIAVKDGHCKLCGENAAIGIEVEEGAIIGDYIAHLPGCFFGRPLKIEDFK